jgi:ParB-like chromosome segregation protein Spo0J
MPARDLHVARLSLSEIYVVGERRPIDAVAVGRIAESIEKIGLQHPITVRFVDRVVDPEDGEEVDGGGYALVAGLHRLEATRSLGYDTVDCVIVKWDDRAARKWEIAENLHRSDLTTQQRADQTAEWIKLEGEEISAKLAVTPRAGRPGAIDAARKELGISEGAARRAVKIASIAPEAKEAARDAGLANNQSALLKVAAAATPEAQVAKVHHLAISRTNPSDPAPAPLDDIDARERWIASGIAWWNKGSAEWREEFNRRTDKPVMPAKWGASA